jgi:hypothetical protein
MVLKSYNGEKIPSLSTILLLIVVASSTTPTYGFGQVMRSKKLSRTAVVEQRQAATTTTTTALLRRTLLRDIHRGGGSTSSSTTALNFLSTAVASVDTFFRTAPYTAAFVTCGLQSSVADLLAQLNTARQVLKSTQPTAASAIMSNPHSSKNNDGDDTPSLNNNSTSSSSKQQFFGISSFYSIFDVKRNLSFLFYGGFYLGCAFEWLYNTAYPKMFGDTITLSTVLGKVVVDLLILAPLVTLPISYIIKALVYRTSIRQELLSYWKDVKQQHVLSKYCAMYLPVTIVAFTLVPAHYRVSFFAIVDFSWVLLLSSISS